MQKLILFALACLPGMVTAQHTFRAFTKDAGTKEPLPGVTVLFSGNGSATASDARGYIEITNIPDGKYSFTFRSIGYKERTDTIRFPLASAEPAEILLESSEEEMEEVVISSTRSTRSIHDIPTRVEFIAGEELEEKGNMKPGDIRMVLAESTGIQTQQTSATSANSSIRIQGLDGRYTQVLKDGLPIYAGAASGLGLLQVPPLDLNQIEVVKGSASTLYGGGAIAGLVNLISKTPGPEREIKFVLNGTSAKGADLSGYYSQRFKKTGVTLFAAHNRSTAYDPAGLDLSAIPQYERYTVNPKLFLYPDEKTTVSIGMNGTLEDRIGGDMHYIRGEGDSTHSYYEKNNTQRFSTQLLAERKYGTCSHLTFKNSLGYFNRVLSTPGYTFNGTQRSSFTELNYANHRENVEWVVGLNLWTENFTEKKPDSVPSRNYDQNTVGAFLQNTWKAAEWFHLETGFRTDYVSGYGPAFLPRISALFKIKPKFTSRLGAGAGYKAPTLFTEESERIHYRNVLPLSARNKPERSYGANWDVNYRTLVGEKITLTFNHLFFYTYLKDPLILLPVAKGYEFQNISGFMESRGMETNAKIGFGDFKLFLGYTYTDAHIRQKASTVENPLTARHRINSVLMYEREEKLKIGLEAYYFSPQQLSNGSTGREYTICGFMVEKLWEKFSLFINFENFLDVRQTRFGAIYTGTLTNPIFNDIYAPLDGFVINGGLKLKL